MRRVMMGSGIFVGIVALSMLMWGITTGFLYWTAGVRGEVEKTELTAGSGSFRIFSYNHFFDLCVNIQKNQANYDAQYDLLQTKEQGTSSYDRTAQNVAVLKAKIEEEKRRYNADSRKEETTALFKANDLPDEIPVEEHKRGDRTVCTHQERSTAE